MIRNGKMKNILLTVLLLICLPCVATAAGRDISPKRVDALIREGSGLWLIDVRSEALYNRSHIEGSINISLMDLPTKRLPENKILVMVDNSLGQAQAKQAARLLPEANNKVFVLAGGVRGWQQEGFPLVGLGDFFELTQVFPNELSMAQKNGVPLNVFDLRPPEESKQAPLGGLATALKGNFETQLDVVLQRLQRSAKRAKEQINGPVPNLLVLPTGVSAAELYQSRLWNFPGDVRVLEGAYLAGAVSETRTVTTGGCMTCPGN
jgi:rhodanese-related sulfurtransferase